MLTKVRIIDYIGLILLSGIWGSSFLFIKISIETIHPTLLTFSRLLIASFFLVIYLKLIKKQKLFVKGPMNKIVIIALLGNVIPFNLISWSETKIDSVIAATLIGTMPFFTFLIAHILNYGEQLNKKISLGLFFGFIGMVIVVFFNKEEHSEISDINFFSSCLVISAAIFYAYSANCVKKINHMNPLQVATMSTIFATMISLPIFIVSINFSYSSMGYEFYNISLTSFLACVFLGIICTGFAGVVFFSLIKKQSAGFASQSNFFIPCFGLFWSYLFLNETINHSLILGLILIVFGVVYVHFGRQEYS
jgi:drug/metabolite transporter (DMT)-like permease